MDIHIRFKIDPKRIKLADLIAIEDAQANGKIPYRLMADLLARQMVDEQGEYLPYETARQQIVELNLEQLNGAMEQFRLAMEELATQAVPPPVGGG